MLKKYFLKRCYSYTAIMLIPFLLCYLVLGIFLFQSQAKKVGEDSLRLLNIATDNIESSMFYPIFQQDVMMSSSNYILSLRKGLNKWEMDQKDINLFTALKQTLSSYASSYSHIFSIYLYLDGTDLFLTSSSMLPVAPDSYYDSEWLEIYRNMPDTQKYELLSRQVQRHDYEDPREIITILARMTYTRGTIVLNIDKKKFDAYMKNILSDGGYQYLLLNNRGEVVYSSNGILECGSQPDPKYFETEEGKKKSSSWMKIHGQLYYCVARQSDSYGMTQACLLSSASILGWFKGYVTAALLLLTIGILVSIALAWTTVKRSFAYIYQCIDVFSKAEKGEEIIKPQDIDDEYGIILNNIIYMYLRNSQMKNEYLEQKHLYEITEMKALQLQINPHFIFNTLQTIDIAAVKEMGNGSEVHTLIQLLARIIKYALGTPEAEVTLREELEYLKSYVRIHEIRFPNNCIVYYEIDSRVMDYQVFRLMLQPILENAFEHGMREVGERLTVKVRIFERKGRVCFVVVDNGVGMSREMVSRLCEVVNNKESRNIGLTNLNRRLVLHYGEESRLRIWSKKGMGTAVGFQIVSEKLYAGSSSS